MDRLIEAVSELKEFLNQQREVNFK